jgi:beta-glucosidase
MACVKHFIGNEQETNRIPPSLIPDALNQSLSSNMDGKTEHELYAWPFQDAIRAGAASVMCAYTRYNNSYGCQNSYSMNGLLKGEFGFQGFVVSDWGAQRTGEASANSGLDMAMPGSSYWQNGNLSQAVSNGTIAQSRLDDMAIRIIAAWYRLEELNSPAFENPGFGMPANLLAPHTLVDARDPSSAETIFQSAVEGHVLVKNLDNTLPLGKPKFLSLCESVASSLALTRC